MKACADVLRVPQEEIKNEAVEKVCNNTIVHVTQCVSVECVLTYGPKMETAATVSCFDIMISQYQVHHMMVGKLLIPKNTGRHAWSLMYCDSFI